MFTNFRCYHGPAVMYDIVSQKGHIMPCEICCIRNHIMQASNMYYPHGALKSLQPQNAIAETLLSAGCL